MALQRAAFDVQEVCRAGPDRLAYEAADAALLNPELAAGIRRVKGVRASAFDSGTG